MPRISRAAFAVLVLFGVIQADPQSPARVRTTSQPGLRPRRAYLIGNNEYTKVTPLVNAANDARDLDKLLKSLGFTTTLLLNGSEGQMKEGFTHFASSVQPGDVALFFYAGHGMQIDGANYLIPVDFVLKNEEEGKKAAFDLERVPEMLQKAGASLSLVAVDACRNNPLRGTRALQPSGFVPMESGAGTLIAFSTSPGQVASDDSAGHNGLYTGQLLRLLPEPLPVSGLFRKVRDMVYEVSQGAQRPYVMEDVIGEYYLVNAASPGGSPQASAAGQPAAPGTGRGALSDHDKALDDGKRLFASGQYLEAARAFDLARRVNPTDPYAYNAAGLAYAKASSLSVAADLFSKAIELNPAYGAAYSNRGMIYLQIPKYSLAVQDFTWAIEADALDPVAYTQRARAYLGIRDYESAAADFQKALELYPDDYQAQNGLGTVAYRQNHMQLSLKYLNEALARNPEFIAALENRALTLKALGRSDEAARDQQRAEKIRRGKP